MNENIRKFVETWEDGDKEANNPQFVKDFTAWVESNVDMDCWEFEGCNDYCGYTAKVYEVAPRYDLGSSLSRRVAFEFAFGFKGDVMFAKVFTLRHNGFWVCEYINLKGEDAKPLLDVLKTRLLSWGGF